MSDYLRHSATEKILRLARMVHAGSFAGTRFYAEYLGVNERTIRRYLIVLDRAGWAVPDKPWTSDAAFD